MRSQDPESFLSSRKWGHILLKTYRPTCLFSADPSVCSARNSPIFVILDDTVCKKTKPSSQATHTIQGASFQHSHLKGQHVYGHAVVQTLLRSGNQVFPFATERYDPKGKSKIDLACEMLQSVPMSRCQTYVLMDSWYPSASVLQTSADRGFHVISGLKTNRSFYPQGIRQSLKSFASYISKSDNDLVTIGSSAYRVYRYEGKLNLVETSRCSSVGKKEKAFLSTDVSLSNTEILSCYCQR
ncbi:transposase [Paenibacillus tundrae]|uniref:transposase n=1 Tax=Paenibacillus tundrae TaxID=528187 RepID=UPI0022A98710|nr:transposase [Paenibacillus tundrae]